MSRSECLCRMICFRLSQGQVGNYRWGDLTAGIASAFRGSPSQAAEQDILSLCLVSWGFLGVVTLGENPRAKYL